MAKKPKKTFKPADVPAEQSGDKCQTCGRYTDSIMQGRGGFVCESCLSNEEESGSERDDRW